MSDDLTMSQRLHSYSVWLLYDGSLFNTERKYVWIPTSQGAHVLVFNSMINLKRSSSSGYYIYLRVVYYCLVHLMGVLVNWNVQSIMVASRIHLVWILKTVMLKQQMMNISSKSTSCF